MVSTPLLPLIDSIVYGPVRSRRLGVSLGLNILPPGSKTCSFNCVYCQYGWTTTRAVDGADWPTAADVGDALATTLRAAPFAREIQRVTFAGHGEPTLHPELPSVVEAVRDVCRRRAPAASVALLTNGSQLSDPRVRAALAQVDERFVKLDAGDQATLRRVNAVGLSFGALMAGIRAVPDIVLQSLFVEDPPAPEADAGARCGNAGVRDREAWLAAVRDIRPLGVHLYTIDRAPALARLRPVSPLVLQSLADRLRADGIAADVFV